MSSRCASIADLNIRTKTFLRADRYSERRWPSAISLHAKSRKTSNWWRSSYEGRSKSFASRYVRL